jgi:hypothetical protein
LNLTVTDVLFGMDSSRVVLADAREIAVALEWVPRMPDAAPRQRKDCELIGDGVGIHRSGLGEDPRIPGNTLAKRLRDMPQEDRHTITALIQAVPRGAGAGEC